MIEPNHDSNDQEPDKDVVDSLRTLKPRAPRLDWNAIKAARNAQNTTLTPATASHSNWSAYRQFALAGCLGLAVGAAFTFFAMNWFILSDLRAKVAQLEQATTTAAQSPSSNEPASARSIAGSDSILDLYAGLETPRLTVSSYRSPPDRLIKDPSSPVEDSSQPQDEPPPTSNRDEVTPLDKALNRLQLFKELRHSI